MRPAQVPEPPSQARPLHLRLAVQVDGAALEVLSADLVDESLEPARQVVGPWVYELREGGETVWVGTMADPTTERGIARPREYEHPYRPGSRGDFIVRVPIGQDSVRRPVEIRVYKLTGPIPANLDELKRLVASGESTYLHRIGTIEDRALRRHRDWARVEAALGPVKRDH